MKTGQDNGEEVEAQSPRSLSVRHWAPKDQPAPEGLSMVEHQACHLGVHAA